MSPLSVCMLSLAALWMMSGRAVAPCVADDGRAWEAVGRRGMVATDSLYASQSGLEILQAGGNAVDAAAAVSFTLAVARPQSTGLGGGGFMIIRLAEHGEVAVLDYRETAPASVTPELFREVSPAGDQKPPASRYGFLAAAVPGQVAGQSEAVKRYGTLPLERLLAPAIKLAEQGFVADEHYVRSARDTLQAYRKYPELLDSCGYVYRVHLGGGRLPRVGDRVVQPQLGRLLRALAAGGPEVFYKGAVADAIERTMKAHGGLMVRADLAAYRVARREPLRATYRGYELILMPPPSSGGVCIAQTLNILENFDLPALRRSDTRLATHYFVEAMKHAFADRTRWMGDPDFVSVPVGLLTGKAYASKLAGTIKPGHVAHLEAYGSATLPDDAGTSHFCVVDRWGNCVVATETINTSFGSLAAVEEWGLILNDEMDDFATRPGEANAYELTQSKRNAVAPRKRPLSSMSPTIVLKDGRPVLLVGGSGGPRIISGVLNVLLEVLDAGKPLPEAVRADRVHHQWKPDRVFFDGPAPEPLARYLRSVGHHVSDQPRTAAVQAILLENGTLIGVSDPRKAGQPAGY